MTGFFGKKSTQIAETAQRTSTAVSSAIVSSVSTILKKITNIRCANYKLSVVNELVSTEMPELKKIVLSLGHKILTANNPSLGAEELGAMEKKFHKTMDSLFETEDKLLIASFSAKLIQYNTIICDQDFSPAASLEDFDKFLATNTAKFGDVSTNLFIAEYKLIKIYNDLCHFNDAAAGNVAPVTNLDKKINYLLEQLTNIKKQTDKWLAAAPMNAFGNYLNFSVCYSCAKAVELQYNLQKASLTEEDVFIWNQTQKAFLEGAQKSLKRIDTINAAAVATSEVTIIDGAEYSLGQNVLIKIPASQEALQEHLSALVKS